MVHSLLRQQSSGRLPPSKSPQVSTKLVFDDVNVPALASLLSVLGASLSDCQLSISHNATHIAVSSGSTLYIIPTEADNSQSYQEHEVDTDNSNHLITSLRWCESLHSSQSLLFVGYTDGHFTVHSSDGQLLTSQHMHTEPLQSFQFILQQKLGHPVTSLLLSYGPSARTVRTIAYVDGGELMEWKSTVMQQTLQHSPKRRKSHAATDDGSVWKFQKWRLVDQQTNCIGPITPMQAFDIDALQSTYSTLPAFVGAGAEPMLAYYRASEEVQDSLNAVSVANEIASKVRSQIFSYASSYTKTWWSASAATSPNNTVEELPPSRQLAEDLDWLRAVKDELRTVETMTLDPSSTYAACSDSLGRVMILDTRYLVIRRMFKGYRDAQTCFIRVAAAGAESKEPQPRAGLYLLILAPHRGLLECWRMLTGERVGYAHVPAGCHLHSSSATTSQTNSNSDFLPTACVVTNSGTLQRINLSAYAATASEQSSSQHAVLDQSASLQSLASKYQQYAGQHLSECNGDSCTQPSASVLHDIGQAVRAAFDAQNLEASASAFDRWFSNVVINSHTTQTYNGYHSSTWSLSPAGSCQALLACILDNAVQSLQPHVSADNESQSTRDDTVEIVHADGSTTTMEIGAATSATRDDDKSDKPVAASLHTRMKAIQQLQQAHSLLQSGTYPHSFTTFLSVFGYIQLTSQSLPQLRVRELVATSDSFQPDLQRPSIQQLAHALFGESQLNEIYLTQGGIEVLRLIRQSELSSVDICLLFCSWWLDLPLRTVETVAEKPDLYRQPVNLYWKAALRITTVSDMVRAVHDAVQHTSSLLHATTLITALLHYMTTIQPQDTAQNTAVLQSDLVHLQQLRSVVAQLQLTTSDTSLSSFTVITPLSALTARYILANTKQIYQTHTAHEKQVQTVASGEMVRSSVTSTSSSDALPVLSLASFTAIVNELLTRLNDTKADRSAGQTVAVQRWKLVTDVDSVLYYCAYDLHRSCQPAKNTLAAEQLRAASAYAAMISPSCAAAGLAVSMWKSLQPYISALCNAALVEELPKPYKSSSTPALTYGNACKFMKTVLQRDGHTLFDITITAHVSNIIEAAQSLLNIVAAVSTAQVAHSSAQCDVLVAAPSLQITADTAGKPPPSDQLQAARERASCNNLLHTHARLATVDSAAPLSNVSLTLYDQSVLRWSQCDKQQFTYADHIDTVLQVLHVMHESDTDMALQIKQHSRLSDLVSAEVIAAVQDRLPQDADDVTSAQQITTTSSQHQARVLFLASVIRQSNAWSSVQHLFQAFQLTAADRTSLLYEHVLVLLEHGQDSAAYDACRNNDDMTVIACAAAHVCRARLGLFVHSLEQRNKTQYNAVIQSVPGNAWSWLAATKPPVMTGNKPADDPTIQLLRARIITIKQRPEHIDLHAAHILLTRSAQWTQRAISGSSDAQVAPLQNLFQQTGVNTISYRTANPLQYAYYYSYQLNEIVQKIRQSFNAA